MPRKATGRSSSTGRLKTSHKSHYRHQLAYFEDEFSRMVVYRLAPWQQSYIERVTKDMVGKNKNGKTLLDIATGSGYMAIEMAKKGINVIACDLAPTSIKNLQQVKKSQKLTNLRLLTCYAEDIPLPDMSVDYIIANAILEHIPEEKKAIEEWKRLLKPGGKLLITVPLKFKYLWPFFWPINYIHDKRIGHLRRYDLADLSQKFGLKVQRAFYTGHFLKVVGAIIGIVYHWEGLEKFVEGADGKYENRVWGASNISVLFEKEV